MAVARFSSGGVTKSQEKMVNSEAFFPTDNALYNIAYKKAEPIEMPFGIMTRVGPRYRVNKGVILEHGPYWRSVITASEHG